MSGQTIPEPTYATPADTAGNVAEYVDSGGDNDEGDDVLIPSDVRLLLKKITNEHGSMQHSNRPDDETADDSDKDKEMDEDDADADGSDNEDAPDWEFDIDEK